MFGVTRIRSCGHSLVYSRGRVIRHKANDNCRLKKTKAARAEPARSGFFVRAQ